MGLFFYFIKSLSFRPKSQDTSFLDLLERRNYFMTISLLDQTHLRPRTLVISKIPSLSYGPTIFFIKPPSLPLSLHFTPISATTELSHFPPLSCSFILQIKPDSLPFQNQARPTCPPPRALSIGTIWIFMHFQAWLPPPSLKPTQLDHFQVRSLFHLLQHVRAGPRVLESRHASLDSISFTVFRNMGGCKVALLGVFAKRYFQWNWRTGKCPWKLISSHPSYPATCPTLS